MKGHVRYIRWDSPCPEPGESVRTTDGRLGIQYKRIHGKLSYARALSYHPELIEQYAVEFAEISKKLHSTVPPAGLFPTIKDQYTDYIKDNPFLTDDERDIIEKGCLINYYRA